MKYVRYQSRDWLLGRDGAIGQLHHRTCIDNRYSLQVWFLTAVPLIFQQSGWLLYFHAVPMELTCSPILAILVVGVLSALASLLLVEAMSHIRGNERFQARVEFTTIAKLYLGRKSHYVLQVILYLALQSVNISSIIISCQVPPPFFVGLIWFRVWTPS